MGLRGFGRDARISTRDACAPLDLAKRFDATELFADFGRRGHHHPLASCNGERAGERGFDSRLLSSPLFARHWGFSKCRVQLSQQIVHFLQLRHDVDVSLAGGHAVSAGNAGRAILGKRPVFGPRP